MFCYACDQTITDPAVPRRNIATGEVVHFHPNCWEACYFCEVALQVFEVVHAGTLYRETGEPRMVNVDGVWVNVCQECIA